MRDRQRLFRIFTIAALLLLTASFSLSADDGVDLDIMPFYLGVSDYYGVPESEVLAVRGQLRPDEVPVVFHIAQHGGVHATHVAALRAEGHSWREISQRLGVAPEAYYVPLERQPGPPYGKAWGYYMNRPRKEWKEWKHFRLSDEEIVDLVNMRFVSDEWEIDRHHIAEMRAHGHDHVTISRNHWPYDFRHGHRPSDRAQEQDGAHHEDAHHEVDRHHVDDRHVDDRDGDDRHHDRGHGSDRSHSDRGKGKDSKKHDDPPPRF